MGGMLIFPAGRVRSQQADNEPETPAVAPEATEPRRPAESAENRPAARTQPVTKESKPIPRREAKPIPKREAKPIRKRILRDDHIKRPGAPRKRIEWFVGDKLDWPALSNAEVDRFDEMRTGRGQLDPALVDKVAKNLVYRLTDPRDPYGISKLVHEAIENIRTARDPGNNDPNLPFITAYKRSLVKYTPDVIEKGSPIARINALLLLDGTLEGAGEVADGVPVLLDVLADPKEADYDYVVAMKGLRKAKRSRLITVAQEARAAVALLSIANRDDTQTVLLEEIVTTLGTLRRAFTGHLPERVEVGTFLANLALDRKQSIRMRSGAAKALGDLDVADIRDWNYDLQIWVVSSAVFDVIEGFKDGKAPQDFYIPWMFGFGKMFKDMRGKHDDAAFRQFLETVISPIFGDIADKKDPDLAPLGEWLGANRPDADAKLTPRALRAIDLQDGRAPKPENPGQ